MREIKFRAWVKEVFDGDELAYGGYMIESREIKTMYLQNISTLMDGPRGTGIESFVQGSFLPGMGHLERFKFDEIELMQYTGKNDRDGKEIFEGDKLFAPGNLSDELQYVGNVVWDEDDARWEVVNFHGRFEWIPDGCVVGGHIYEKEAAADA